ncbi:MAG: DUF262 domain-containing protein [Oscillatoria sp. PMC 1051.18]|nr:DUF262 domain-containing protein [Oscillatoria sp. PMC 1050.18]MEC5032931.1 DUF262 domain-containing protein [Oscillatoria sp. PMC 1051.18]
MPLAPSEKKMWDKIRTPSNPKISDEEIIDKYEKGEKRILTEMNREKLPSFAESLKKPGYMEIRPFFQRRSRWDKKKQSRLIESFLINVPVPPIILYEKNYNSYEVMDGQQRITAIRDFYENKLKLTGLELWSELNERTYEELPRTIKAGIDRRSISSIVLLTESTSDREEELFLKQLAFERLNTGGVRLGKQEVRHCLYYGKFEELLIELASYPIFAKAWGIPLENSEQKKENNLYKKMEDVELVLRFFALRHINKFAGGVDDLLDKYMIKSIKFTDLDIEELKENFIKTIELAHSIYQEALFKPFYPDKKRPYKAYYDAVMVGFSNHLSNEQILINRRSEIIEKTNELLQEDRSRLFTGGGKTKAQLQERIQRFDSMLTQVIAE